LTDSRSSIIRATDLLPPLTLIARPMKNIDRVQRSPIPQIQMQLTQQN
jgi:hypothetical protein